MALPFEIKSVGVTIGPLRMDQVSAVAQLRCDAFFLGSDRTVEDDEAGLGALLARRAASWPAHASSSATRSSPPATSVPGSPASWSRSLSGGGESAGGWFPQPRLIAQTWIAGKYLYTHDAENFYAAIGWQVVERFVDQGEPMVLMSRRLGEEG